MDWIQIAQSLGIPVACLIAFTVAVWQAVVWLGRNVAKPVADRHVKFLDDLSAATTAQAQALQTMTVQQSKNLDVLTAVVGQQSEATGKLGEIMGAIKDLISKQDVLIRDVTEMKTWRMQTVEAGTGKKP